LSRLLLQTFEGMKKENNNPKYLKFLLSSKLITFQNYLFRLKASQLNINTYQKKETNV